MRTGIGSNKLFCMNNDQIVKIHSVCSRSSQLETAGIFQVKNEVLWQKPHKEVCIAPANTTLSLRQCFYFQEL